MSELLDRYLDASERDRVTVSTFLRKERRGQDAAAYRSLMSEIEQEIKADRVRAVPSRGGATAYIEVIE